MASLNALKPVLRLPFRPRTHAIAPSTSLKAVPSQHFSSSPHDLALSSGMGAIRTLGRQLTPNPAMRGPSMREHLSVTGHPQEQQPWHLHCFSTKHNTHLTLTNPKREAIIAVSTGQIGFKKAQRGSYDAAYQLGAYLMARIQRAGLVPSIDNLELVYRGWGQGRDAFTKIMTGTEGTVLRGKVVSVTDSSRLKFGGTRSKKPRRLG